jgi:hypothetical protein
MLLTTDRQFLEHPTIAARSAPVQPPGDAVSMWTDDYSNLLQILK